EVVNSRGIVVVDFWADWCGPCQILGPIIEELSHEFAGKVKFAKMDVEENLLTPIDLNIRSLPTLKFFRDGQEIGELIGNSPKQIIANKIKDYLS
ncbi:MAG TPA: thioredoxin, partial [Candidatus Gracilibacteria bacterium]|nr:thioredoxin [Candidatus Gracilibacteria bacterium]